jgi:hypothetical protein
MTDEEQRAVSEYLDVEGPSVDAPQVFVSDASAEAEGAARALRQAGYLVADVPLSMLYSRVAVQRPHVILLDADAEGAFDCVRRIRLLPEATLIDVLFMGRPGAALSGLDEALERGGGGFFPRPVDVHAVVSKVELLTGVAPKVSDASPFMPSVPPPRPSAAQLPSPSMRASDHPPPMRPSAQVPPARASRPPGLEHDDRPGRPSMPSLGPLSAPSLREAAGAMSRPLGLQGPLSPELERLLGDAEDRELTPDEAKRESNLPSPDEEIEMVLPAEVLASLDEPLDDETEDESEPALGRASVRPGAMVGARRGTSELPNYYRGVSETQSGNTGAGSVAPGTGAGSSSQIEARARTSSVPPRATLHSTREGDRPFARLIGAQAASAFRAHGTGTGTGAGTGTGTGPGTGAGTGPGTGAGRTGTSPGAAISRTLVSSEDAIRSLAFAVTTRLTGCLLYRIGGVDRRIVLRDGDFVTAASSSDDEGLLSFLVSRGDLPRSVAARHVGKVSGAGKHAGAALVAHGLLSQEQLWPALRAHAEWLILSCALQTEGSIAREEEPPGRLKSEPSVFGGSTGAEVFIEFSRRLFAPDDALSAMGGGGSRLVEGASYSLLRECALSPEDEGLAHDAKTTPIGEVIARAPEPELASVFYGLSLLSVFDVLRSERRPQDLPDASSKDIQVVEEDAVRERVRARMALVDEADYFAILGVPRGATGYEIRRAYVELRRAFEPTRLLSTPALTPLLGDVQKIVTVLEEAYEILRDSARRERYRNAIDAGPPG